MKSLRALSCSLLFVVIPVLAFAQVSATSTPAPVTEDKIDWYDTAQWEVEGKGWPDTVTHYARIPERAKGVIPDSVWNLSLQSSGLLVRFKTDADTIRARHKVTGNLTMPHMTTVGSSGLDLYAKDEKGQWRWAGFSKPDAQEYDQALLSGASKAMREYAMYLPLYNRTESLVIGVPEGSHFEALPPLAKKPILYYGTSIAHGCSASRPGMAVPAILGRRLDYTVINFAFSGSGRMEEEMADLIGEIDAEVFVLDCLPNMTLDHVNDRTEIFVRKLRELHPDTPIIFVEDRTLSNAWLLPWWQENHAKKRASYRKTYDKLVAEGMTGLSYVEGEHLLGDDGDGTVDGSHPTDLGMVRMADFVEPYLRKALDSIKK